MVTIIYIRQKKGDADPPPTVESVTETDGEEMEAKDVVDAESFQLQNDWTEVAPLHLRHGGWLELLEALLCTMGRREERGRRMEGGKERESGSSREGWSGREEGEWGEGGEG